MYQECIRKRDETHTTVVKTSLSRFDSFDVTAAIVVIGGGRQWELGGALDIYWCTNL